MASPLVFTSPLCLSVEGWSPERPWTPKWVAGHSPLFWFPRQHPLLLPCALARTSQVTRPLPASTGRSAGLEPASPGSRCAPRGPGLVFLQGSWPSDSQLRLQLLTAVPTASPVSQGSANVQAPAVAPRHSHPHTTCSVQHTRELLSHPRLPGHGAEARRCALRPLGAQGGPSAQGSPGLHPVASVPHVARPLASRPRALTKLSSARPPPRRRGTTYRPRGPDARHPVPTASNKGPRLCISPSSRQTQLQAFSKQSRLSIPSDKSIWLVGLSPG